MSQDFDLIALLNQYRGAEIRGAGVILRLGRLANSSELRSNFSRHLRDEGVHAWMWTRTLHDLGGDVMDVDDPYQMRLGSLFGIPRTLNELLALTVVSERRGVATYEEHLSHPGTPPAVQRTLRGILKDERWHVEWIEDELRQRSRDDTSVDDLLARAEAADVEAVRSIRVAVDLPASPNGAVASAAT